MELTGHSDPAFGVAISRCGTRVRSASDDETVQVWDACTGEKIRPSLKGHTRAVNYV